MRFRPEDQYCKPTIARANKTSNLVLKVKRRHKKVKNESDAVARDSGRGEAESRKEIGQRGEENDGRKEYEYSMELLGIVNTTYQFPGIEHPALWGSNFTDAL